MARPDQQALEADEPVFFRQTGPTVVIRRRRLISVGGAAGHAASDGTDATGLPAAKTPKVYRLQPTEAADRAPEADATAGVTEHGPAAVMPRRRPRNALRAPTLLSHVVFEQPERHAEAAVADIAPQPPSNPPQADDASSYEAVCQALGHVRAALDAARQARRFGLQMAASHP
jgi:hypothetical protein